MVAAITTAGTIAVAYLGARIRSSRNGGGQLTDDVKLRDNQAVAEARADIWKERYEREVAGRDADRALAVSDKAEVLRTLELTRHDLDDCRRERSNLYAELRSAQQLAERRRRPRS